MAEKYIPELFVEQTPSILEPFSSIVFMIRAHVWCTSGERSRELNICILRVFIRGNNQSRNFCGQQQGPGELFVASMVAVAPVVIN